jgi:hypothetical protein
MNHYQVCRWYDPYPRLAFALKLLYFAPIELREAVMRELAGILDLQMGTLKPDIHPVSTGNLWYDDSLQTAKTVELLKQSPEPLKIFCTEKLLESLDRIAS